MFSCITGWVKRRKKRFFMPTGKRYKVGTDWLANLFRNLCSAIERPCPTWWEGFLPFGNHFAKTNYSYRNWFENL